MRATRCSRHFVCFSRIQIARPNWDANSWQDMLSADSNSLRHLPRWSRKNCFGPGVCQHRHTSFWLSHCSWLCIGTESPNALSPTTAAVQMPKASVKQIIYKIIYKSSRWGHTAQSCFPSGGNEKKCCYCVTINNNDSSRLFNIVNTWSLTLLFGCRLFWGDDLRLHSTCQKRTTVHTNYLTVDTCKQSKINHRSWLFWLLGLVLHHPAGWRG